jgi:hypothetical protein
MTNLVLHAALLICMVSGSGQQPCEPGLDHLGLARPKKKIKGYVGLRLAQPKVPGLGPVSWADPAHIVNII